MDMFQAEAQIHSSSSWLHIQDMHQCWDCELLPLLHEGFLQTVSAHNTHLPRALASQSMPSSRALLPFRDAAEVHEVGAGAMAAPPNPCWEPQRPWECNPCVLDVSKQLALL